MHARHGQRLLSIPLAWCLAAVPWAAGSAVAGELPSPRPRGAFVAEELRRWNFTPSDSHGWTARNDCRVSAADGRLVIEATGGDPYADVQVRLPGRGFTVRLRLRTTAAGDGQLFWSSTSRPGYAADREETFPLVADGAWHEYDVVLEIDGDLTGLRLDPGSGPGLTEIDWIAIHRGGLHPLEIVRLEHEAGAAACRAIVRHHGDTAITATIDGVARELPPHHDTPVVFTPDPGPLTARSVRVEAPGLPAVERTFFVYRPAEAAASDQAVVRQVGGLTIHVARDGSVVRIVRGGRDVVALAPLVHAGGRLPALAVVDAAAWPLVLTGDGVRVTLGADGDDVITVGIEPAAGAGGVVADDAPFAEVEGPVVRAFGRLEQGLLAGVEYLGRDEQSSSTLDIETAEHLRVEPDRLDVTLPLMAFVTDAASVALTWADPAVQPSYATPDFVDHAPGHRMTLRGGRIAAAVRVTAGWPDGERLEQAILWAVQRRGGLPPPPPAPRSFAEQMRLSLDGYDGIIRDHDRGGWFHAVVPGVRTLPAQGAPLADLVSTIFRITGTLPPVDGLALGGAHVRDSTSYLVSGRGREWRAAIDDEARATRARQRPDGSWRYDGEFRRGHFEDTASGLCATSAVTLLEHARLTGAEDSLAAGLRGLAFLRRFRTPRGAQTWEVPLHTPDLLASAHATWAAVRAFELTGDATHLDEARRWAITGLPFVYQWSDRPVMLYATIAVYGATQWRRPNWIGLPVQWCGLSYAHALLLLAAHDTTLEWRRLAEGIVVCGEQMQYPDGPSRGTLPDVFDLRRQQRLPADINPSVLVGLRRQLRGLPTGLSVAVGDDGRRVVAPFPVAIATVAAGAVARVRAPANASFEVQVCEPGVPGGRFVRHEAVGAAATAEGVVEIPLPTR
jgi:hypothetical protein